MEKCLRAPGGGLAVRGSVAGNGPAGNSAGQCAQVDEPARPARRGAGAQSALVRQLAAGGADGVVPDIVLAALGVQPAPLRADRGGPAGGGCQKCVSRFGTGRPAWSGPGTFSGHRRS